MPHASSRASDFDDILLAACLGFMVFALAWMTQGGTAPASTAPHRVPAPFAQLHRVVMTAAETVVFPAAPSTYQIEKDMSPSALMARWKPLVAEASRRFRIPETWIAAVMRMESGGRTMLAEDRPMISRAGAVGVMQMMPATYEEMRAQHGLGADPHNPHDNVLAGAAYLRFLYGRYGYPAMFAAYNGGPGVLEDHLSGLRGLPAETQNYLAVISRNLGPRGANS